MSSSPRGVGAAPEDASSAGSGAGRRRSRSTLALVVVVLGIAVLLVVLGGGTGQEGRLDPRNPRPQGAEAVARVLADQGVSVRIVRGQAALLSTDVGAGTTVLATSVDQLGTSTLRTFQRHTRQAGAVVLAGSAPALEDAFDLEPGFHDGGLVGADCEDPLLRGLQISTVSGPAYAPIGADPCFPTDGEALLPQPRAGERLLLAPEVLTNRRITEADNAAVALRLLGQHPRLVWYVADGDDLVADDGVGLASLVPRWVVPGLSLVGLAVVAFLLWQGRRLGPLVTEPLPVVVRAAESTESRGRLYAKARDRDHAAHLLRRATVSRLAARLALPAHASVADVAREAAPVARRPEADLIILLTDAPVRDDVTLLRLGRDLTLLEDEVHPT